MTYEIFAQAIGFIALIVGACSYQFKEQKTLFFIWIVADTIWVIQYIMIAAITPAIAVSIAALRTLSVIFIFPKAKKQILIFSFFCTVFLCALASGGKVVSYLPILSGAFYCLATYYHENYILSRPFMGIGKITWLIIGIVFVSYAEITASILGLTSLIIGAYRHKFLQVKKQTQTGL